MADDSLAEAIDGGEAIEAVGSDSHLGLDDTLQESANGDRGDAGSRAPKSSGEAPGEAWVEDTRQRLSVCADCEQLEEIIFDETQRFVPAVLEAAFVALARVGTGKRLPLQYGEGMSDEAYEALLSEATPAGTVGQDILNMGAVLLAHALDTLQSSDPAHVSVMLEAMGLMGLIVEEDIMLDLVRHAVLTLESFKACDVVHLLLGLAMLEHQPDENSIRAFESKVGAVATQFDTSAQRTLLWCFARLGREKDVQNAREAYQREIRDAGHGARSQKVRAKAVFLHGEELRQSFHPKLLRCPLLMHRRIAMPPKHITKDGSILAMNERPAFSLRFTNPWGVLQMQRAEELREIVRTERKPLLKGQRDKVYRSVRMTNMHKRFVAEDDQLIINPNQSEKDQELCEELSRIKVKYTQALKQWRSEEHKERAALQELAQQLQAGVEQKQAALAQAQSSLGASIPLQKPHREAHTRDLLHSPTKPQRETSSHSEFSQRSDPEEYQPAPRKLVTAKVMWARFPKNMFSSGCSGGSANSSGGGSEDTNQNPELQYFELWIDGVSTHQRTGGIPWAPESDWYDSFFMCEPGPDTKVEFVWNYKARATGETCVGGSASLDWNTIDLRTSSNEVVLSLDILEGNARSQHEVQREVPDEAQHKGLQDAMQAKWFAQREAKLLGVGGGPEEETAPPAQPGDFAGCGGEPRSKVGTCSVYFSNQEKLEHLVELTRLPSNSLVPPNEDQVAKCTRLLKREMQFAEKKLKEAENKVDAQQSHRWQALQDLEEQHAELVQAIILHRRVFGFTRKEDEPALGAMDLAGQSPVSARSSCSRKSGIKGAVYAQSQPFYSFTAAGEESLSIGVFDTAASMISSFTKSTPIHASPGHLPPSCASSSAQQFDAPVQGDQSERGLPDSERPEADAGAVGTPKTPKTPNTPMSASTPISVGLTSATKVSGTPMSRGGARTGSRPSSCLSRPSSRLSSPSHTFPVDGSATARSRRRPANLDKEREALPGFSSLPPPSVHILHPNIIRMVTGVDSRNPAPGSRPKPSEENVTGSPLVQHNEPFDMRFYANDPPLVDMYVHSKMKPPLMKQEGFLKHYLKAREMAITTKRSPSRRDSQWDSGPEQLAKDRDVRAWRWDSQPVYPVLLKKCLCKAYYATYKPRDDAGQSRSPRMRYKYKRHITHADASAISAWPRGSPRGSRPPSSATTPRSSATTPRRSPPSSATTPASSRRGPATALVAQGTSNISSPRTPMTPMTPTVGLGATGTPNGDGGRTAGRRTVTTPRGSNRRGGHAKTQGGGGTSEREFQDFGNPEISDVRPATAPAPAAKMQLPSAPSAGKASKESTD